MLPDRILIFTGADEWAKAIEAKADKDLSK
jgi:hypothetical protein